MLLARVQAPSTVDTDVTIGLREAVTSSTVVPVEDPHIKPWLQQCRGRSEDGLHRTCSGIYHRSGRMAALGAGAKIIGTYSTSWIRNKGNPGSGSTLSRLRRNRRRQ